MDRKFKVPLAVGTCIYLLFFLVLHTIALMMDIRCVDAPYRILILWSVIQLVGNITLLCLTFVVMRRMTLFAYFWHLFGFVVAVYTLWIIVAGPAIKYFIASRQLHSHLCIPKMLLFTLDLQILLYFISVFICTIGAITIGIVMVLGRCINLSCCAGKCSRVQTVFDDESQVESVPILKSCAIGSQRQYIIPFSSAATMT